MKKTGKGREIINVHFIFLMHGTLCIHVCDVMMRRILVMSSFDFFRDPLLFPITFGRDQRAV